MKSQQIGSFEEVVLLTVAGLSDEAYGLSIKLSIEEHSGKNISIGALRTTLGRLEKKGFLTSELGEATSIRGGKRKRFYTISQAGKDMLVETMALRKQLWNNLPDTILNTSWNP